MPFGIQSTQIHLNYWDEKDFDIFKKFIEKNSNKIISYEEAIKKINNNYKLVNFFIKKILQLKRFIKK